MTPTPSVIGDSRKRQVVIAQSCVLALVIVWTFWPAFMVMAEKWRTDPQYSHGYLVPVFAIGLAIWRRKSLELAKLQSDRRGLVLIALAAALYVTGAFLYLDTLESAALIPALFGAMLIAGGPALLKWGWPMTAFLAFMIPLPYRIETALGGPLLGVATRGSTWLLQVLGLPAVSEGNIILLEHGRIAVVEACNGLSMLLTFTAMTTAVAMVVARPMLDRVLIVLSTVPVALLVNILRIAANGVAIEAWGVETAHEWFHDQGGWLMMPVALTLLWGEVKLLNRLFVERVEATPVVILPPAPRRRPAVAHAR